MSWEIVTLWLLLFVTVLLAFVLYIRIDAHDWGMVGLAILAGGLAVLMFRAMLMHYSVTTLDREMFVLWRISAIAGGGVLSAGIIAGIFRDPPPLDRVIRRLVFAAVLVTVLVLAIDLSLRWSGQGGV